MKQRIRTLGVIMLASLLLLSGVAQAATAGKDKDKGKDKEKGKARITWSLARVEREVAPGATTTVSVSFRSSAAVDNLRLQVNGGLGRVVTVAPATIAHVDANTAVAVTLTITVPAGAKSGAAGVIQIKSGKRTVPQNLHVKVRVPGQADDDDDDDD